MWPVAVESGRMTMLYEITLSRMYVWFSWTWSSSRAVRLEVSACSYAFTMLGASLESLRACRGDGAGWTLAVIGSRCRLCLWSSGLCLGATRLVAGWAGRCDSTGWTLLVEIWLGRGAARLSLGSSGRRLSTARLCLWPS